MNTKGWFKLGLTLLMLSFANNAILAQVFYVPRNSTTIYTKQDSISIEGIKSKLILAGYSIETETINSLRTICTLYKREAFKIQIIVNEIKLDAGNYWVFRAIIDNSFMANAISSSFVGIGTTSQSVIFDLPASNPTSRKGKLFGEIMKIVYSCNPNLTFSVADSKGLWKYDLSKYK